MKCDHFEPGAILWVNQIGDNVGKCSKCGEIIKLKKPQRIKVNVEIECPANSDIEVRLNRYPNGVITGIGYDKQKNAFMLNISYDSLIDTEDWKFIQGSMEKEQ